MQGSLGVTGHAEIGGITNLLSQLASGLNLGSGLSEGNGSLFARLDHMGADQIQDHPRCNAGGSQKGDSPIANSYSKFLLDFGPSNWACKLP